VHPQDANPAPLRGFMGGDIKGVTAKIKEGYFNDLGVNAIWTTPLVQNIDGSVDEGTGISYGFHGYWTKDWTMLDPRVGTKEDYKEMIKEAHKHGIRVIMDVVINHTGPATKGDPAWPNDWVRTKPRCTYKDSKTTIECTLVENLPDILTESTKEVTLPPSLVNKWKSEGRYEKETKSLEAFFASTGLPRTPANYIVKWLIDYVEELGIDGFRIDTAKHVEEGTWVTLVKQAKLAFQRWKETHPAEKLDDNEFFTVGEVYNYGAKGGQEYDFGDRKANYFKTGMTALINFGFKHEAKSGYDTLFALYDTIANMSTLKDYAILNYLASHDDGDPFDKERKKAFEAANKLLLSPGMAQIYYGDETSRLLNAQADGDAKLRSYMNWESIGSGANKDILTHYQKLGKFRSQHPAVTKGQRSLLSTNPYLDTRTKGDDTVVIGLDLPLGEKEISVPSIQNGTVLKDHYSGSEVKVTDGKIKLNTPHSIVLLSK
jgi:alpha-amylase